MGFFEGLLGCLRPVWTIIGKATQAELKQQGKDTNHIPITRKSFLNIPRHTDHTPPPPSPPLFFSLGVPDLGLGGGGWALPQSFLADPSRGRGGSFTLDPSHQNEEVTSFLTITVYHGIAPCEQTDKHNQKTLLSLIVCTWPENIISLNITCRIHSKPPLWCYFTKQLLISSGSKS